MSHNVTVHQLRCESRKDGAFLNVLNGYGFVGVWGITGHQYPTVLLRGAKQGHVGLMSFGSRTALAEWLAGDQLREWTVEEVTQMGLLPVERPPLPTLSGA